MAGSGDIDLFAYVTASLDRLARIHPNGLHGDAFKCKDWEVGTESGPPSSRVLAADECNSGTRGGAHLAVP